MKKILFVLVAAMLFGFATAEAKTPVKKKAARTEKAASFDASKFAGTFGNGFRDFGDGMVTEHIVIKLDSEKATAKYHNDNGSIQDLYGEVKGSKLVLYYCEDNEEFGTCTMYDGDTLKIDTFTGTFKRMPDQVEAPAIDVDVDVSPTD